MQDLPVFEAVIEVIQAVLLSFTPDVPYRSIGVDIKSKKKLWKDAYSDCQVFYVRVTSGHDLDFQKCFKDDVFGRLTEVLLHMQGREEEGHLSIQRPCTDDLLGCVQEVFWLDQGDKSNVTLKCQHSTHVPSIDSSELSPFVIHFRVVQKEYHIVSTGNRIHKYLHKMKFLNDKIETTFSMKVCGAVCQTDFSVKKYLSLKGVPVVDDIKYFYGHGCLKSLWCGTVKGFSGRCINITNANQQSARIPMISVTSMACLYPLTERYPQSKDSFGISGHIVTNFYGPERIPLVLSNTHLQELDKASLTDWGQFALCLKDTAPKQQLHGDAIFSATLTNLRYLPPWASGCTSFLLCIAVVFVDCQADVDSERSFEIIKYLQDEPKSLKCMCPFINESLTSTLGHIFVHRETEQEKLYRKAYVQCNEMITSSICDIFNHSTEIIFRSNMMQLTQVENKDEMKTKLKNALTKLSNVSENLNLETITGERDIDVWENNVLTGRKKGVVQPASLDVPSLLSQHSTPQAPQFVDNEESELQNTHAGNRNDGLSLDFQDLNEFDNTVQSQDTSPHQGHDQRFGDALQEHPNSEMDFSAETVYLQQPHNDFSREQELEFFADDFDQHDLQVADNWNIEVVADAGTEMIPSTGLSTPAQIAVQRLLPHPAESGDEWLNDVVLDMTEWI